MWVPGYMDIVRNKKANALARREAAIRKFQSRACCGTTIYTNRKIVPKGMAQQCSDTALEMLLQTCNIIPTKLLANQVKQIIRKSICHVFTRLCQFLSTFYKYFCHIWQTLALKRRNVPKRGYTADKSQISVHVCCSGSLKKKGG